jgi:aminopeptidase-like protein
MHRLISRLFPFNRSITGNGLRKTFRVLKEYAPLKVHEVRTGTKVFDWTVPPEWNVLDAYVKDETGRRVIDFHKSNLHLMGYSEPFRGMLSLSDLKKHLYTMPKQPKLIPYVTSYFKRQWGFCLRHEDFKKLKPGKYEVVVDTTLAPGSLTYADLVIPGREKKEVFISTYICHPSMANNELSGPAVAIYLARLLMKGPKPRFTYRFAFTPETIGAIVYLSKHLEYLKKNVIAGYVLTCIGDRSAMSYLKTLEGNTLSDTAAARVLGKNTKYYTFKERGSQERQYCPAGVDLPMGCLMRSAPASKHYPQYHTSADDLSFVTPAALQDSLERLVRIIGEIEGSVTYRSRVFGEPNLGKRGLYSLITNNLGPNRFVMNMLDILAYSNGKRDVRSIAEHLKEPVADLEAAAKILLRAGLLERV